MHRPNQSDRKSSLAGARRAADHCHRHFSKECAMSIDTLRVRVDLDARRRLVQLTEPVGASRRRASWIAQLLGALRRDPVRGYATRMA
jgi:hypothetical protein